MEQGDINLENYGLTRLNIEHIAPQDGPVEITGFDAGWDYDVQIHNEDKTRYRLIFHNEFQELSDQGEKAGYHVQCTMVGLFVFAEKLTREEREKYIRLNGVAMLYSTLRGVLSTITGVFPDGKITLPAIVPQEIVKTVEKKKMIAREQEKKSRVAEAPKKYGKKK